VQACACRQAGRCACISQRAHSHVHENDLTTSSKHLPQRHVATSLPRRVRPISPLNTHADRSRTALGVENLPWWARRGVGGGGGAGRRPVEKMTSAWGAGRPVSHANDDVTRAGRAVSHANDDGTRSARGMIAGRPVSHANDDVTRSVWGIVVALRRHGSVKTPLVYKGTLKLTHALHICIDLHVNQVHANPTLQRRMFVVAQHDPR
jgi:hypothetical protein